MPCQYGFSSLVNAVRMSIDVNVGNPRSCTGVGACAGTDTHGQVVYSWDLIVPSSCNTIAHDVTSKEQVTNAAEVLL